MEYQKDLISIKINLMQSLRALQLETIWMRLWKSLREYHNSRELNHNWTLLLQMVSIMKVFNKQTQGLSFWTVNQNLTTSIKLQHRRSFQNLTQKSKFNTLTFKTLMHTRIQSNLFLRTSNLYKKSMEDFGKKILTISKRSIINLLLNAIRKFQISFK